MAANRSVHTSRRSGTGFTLIELLVVVSILALLIAILLPSLRGAREQAKRVKCFANLHAIHVALICYADDNRQELPSYSTMGEWGFRVAPGRRVPGKGTSPMGYPEAFGVQAVLQTGHGPKIHPASGVAKLDKCSPVYLPGDSAVWICPANPGPKDDAGQWLKYGNTYFYRTNSGGKSDFEQPGGLDPEDPEGADQTLLAKKNYNIDYLNRNIRLGRLALLTMDNYVYYPAPSGMGRPASTDGYTVPTHLRQAPHRVISTKKDIANFWCANYADGHCSMNMWNH
jgi:prepilin-type N-terminal cleavage/methylation domain-containing protein